MALSHSEIQSLKWARARGLDKLGKRVGDITKTIDSLLKGKRKIRVLEIGFGFGTVLMQLQKIYGNKIELYGMSKRRGHGDWKDIKKVAVEEKIFSGKEMLKVPKPSLHFGDVDNGLPFRANTFDFVFSQVSFFYYLDKAAFLEDLNRVLKPTGIARIDVNIGRDTLPSQYSPSLEIWKGGKEVSFWTYINKFPTLTKKKALLRPYLEMRKCKKLSLGLKLVHTIDLNLINSDWWGTKSIYKVV